MEIDEIRVILAGFHSEPEEETPTTFEFARDLESAEMYADAIVTQVDRRGTLWAACADVASSVGACDYDEAVLAVEAVSRQWERVADCLDCWEVLPIKVRMAAGQLSEDLLRDDLDREMLPDLVTVCSLEDELGNHAAALAMADDKAEGRAYLEQHGARIQQAFEMLAWLKADLRSRGELGLDDEVLPVLDETDEI